MFALFALVLLVIGMVFSQNDVDLELNFEHSIGNQPWVSRGNLKFVLSKAEKKLSVKLDNPTFDLSGEDIKKLNSPSAMMRVRIPVLDASGQVLPGRFLVVSCFLPYLN
jgi:hypothetical protein